MAQQNQSELTEKNLRELLEKFSEVIVRPRSFRNDDFDIINFHETQNFEDHSLGKIVTMLENYNAEGRSILQVLYDHLARPGAGGGQQADSDDQSNQKWSFNNTFLLMEQGLKLMMEGELTPEMPQIMRDELKLEVLKWSVELWFLGQVSHCRNVEVSQALQKITNQLFEKYSHSDSGYEGLCRLTILRENDCTDLVKQLLTKDHFGTDLKEFLRNLAKFIEFNRTPMSMPMVTLLTPYSPDRYIIPMKGELSKAYGFYVMGVYEGTNATPLTDKEEYKAIKKAYEAMGLYDPNHFDELLKNLPMPTQRYQGWSAQKLRVEIEKHLVIIGNFLPTCSFLCLALHCHGFHEHFNAPEFESYEQIKELLKVLQQQPKDAAKVDGAAGENMEEDGEVEDNKKTLKGIPKLVIIQACQGYEAGFKHYGLPEYVEKETDATILVMTRPPGAYSDGSGYVGSYLKFFGKVLISGENKDLLELIKSAAEERYNAALEQAREDERAHGLSPAEEKELTGLPPKTVLIHTSAKVKDVILPKLRRFLSQPQGEGDNNNR